MMDEIELQQIEELHQTLVDEAEQAAHRGGIQAGQSLILPSIELSTNFAIMVLHIKLGLTLALYNQSFLFIFDNLEVESNDVRHKRLQLVEAKADYENKRESLIAWENDPIVETEKLRIVIAKFFKIKKDFEQRPEGSRAPSNIQIERYQFACEKLEELEPQWNQFGFDIREDYIIEAKQRYEQYILLKEVRKSGEKESKKQLSESLKLLQQARKNQHHKPFKQATEVIMFKYGIETQAYHSHSLIGEHCHRLYFV